jgi:cytochrome P450 family 110
LVDDFATLYTVGADIDKPILVALYYVFDNPKIKEKLSSELKNNIPEPDNLKYDCFKNCHYLEAVILETLRVYSVSNGMFPREAQVDHHLEVDGTKIKIKKGTIICTQAVSTHFKESIYKDPNVFDPERFLDSEGKIKNPEPFTFICFSLGMRGCLGRLLAMTEIKTVLATFINSFDLKIKDEGKRMKMVAFVVTMQNVRFFMKALR